MSNLSSSRPSFALSIYGQEEEINRLKKYSYKMSPLEEKELLRLTKENNYMLRALLSALKHDNNIDFVNNVVANLLANKMERR